MSRSDVALAVAFVAPYGALFGAFAVYPIGYALWMGSKPSLYADLLADPLYLRSLFNTLLFVGVGVNVKLFLALLLSGFFMRPQRWIKLLLVVYLLPWMLPAVQACMSIRWMLAGEDALVDRALAVAFGVDGPIWFQSLVAGARRQHRRLRLEVDAVLDRDLSRGPHGHSPRRLRRGHRRRRRWLPPLRPPHVPVAGQPLSRLHAALHHLDDGRVHHGLFRFRRRARVDDRSAGDAGLPLRLRRREPGARRGGRDLGSPAAGPARDRADARAPHEGRAAVRLRRLVTETGAVMLGIVLLIWTLIPVYTMLLIALDPEEGEVEFSGNLWPPAPSLESFRVVLTQDARYLEHFWRQLGNSLYIGLSTMVLTVLIASLATFAVARM